MPTALPPRVPMRALLALAFFASAVVAACNRDIVEPTRSTLQPHRPSADNTPPHIDRGPCYVWGPDALYVASGFWSVGEPTSVSACGVNIDFYSTPDTATGIGEDSRWPYYCPPTEITDTATGIKFFSCITGAQYTRVATYWTTGNVFPHLSGNPFGADPLIANFNPPVKQIDMNWYCSTVPGNVVTAYGASGQVLAQVQVPYGPPTHVVTPISDGWDCFDSARPFFTIAVPGIRKLKVTAAPNSYLGDASVNLLQVEFTKVVADSARLKVTLSKEPASVGDTITYTAGTTIPATFNVTAWKWKADTGFAAQPPKGYVEKLKVMNCAQTNITCRHTPGSSGTIWVYGVVNGMVDSVGKHLSVTLKSCPPDGDPILDSADVRQALKDVWRASMADVDSIVANHAEYMWGVYRLPDGSIIAQQATFAGTPCGVDPAVPLTVGGTAILVATIHPHPFMVGQVYPPSCGSMAGDKYNPGQNSALFGGHVSTDDWQAGLDLAQAAGRPIPGYVIDYDGIYRYDATQAGIQTLPTGLKVITKISNSAAYRGYPRFDASKNCGRP